MIFISHRGNINGKNIELENSIAHIENALNCGFDVEIDVWYVDGTFYLGHDEPKYHITPYFLHNTNLWCHAKNVDAMAKMVANPSIHCFWHQKDMLTITSKGFVWSLPNEKVCPNSISVLPELSPTIDWKQYYGICSDFVERYHEETL